MQICILEQHVHSIKKLLLKHKPKILNKLSKALCFTKLMALNCPTEQKREEYSNQMTPSVWFSKPEFITFTLVFIASRQKASTSPPVLN